MGMCGKPPISCIEPVRSLPDRTAIRGNEFDSTVLKKTGFQNLVLQPFIITYNIIICPHLRRDVQPHLNTFQSVRGLSVNFQIKYRSIYTPPPLPFWPSNLPLTVKPKNLIIRWICPFIWTSIGPVSIHLHPTFLNDFIIVLTIFFILLFIIFPPSRLRYIN